MYLGILETAESFKVERLLSNVLIKPREVGVMPTLSIFKHFFKSLRFTPILPCETNLFTHSKSRTKPLSLKQYLTVIYVIAELGVPTYLRS